MYHLSESELDELSCGYASVDQMLLGVVAGVLLSTGIVLATVALDAAMKAIFGAFCFASLIMAIFFLARVLTEQKKMGRRMGGIKRQHTAHSI